MAKRLTRRQWDQEDKARRFEVHRLVHEEEMTEEEAAERVSPDVRRWLEKWKDSKVWPLPEDEEAEYQEWLSRKSTRSGAKKGAAGGSKKAVTRPGRKPPEKTTKEQEPLSSPAPPAGFSAEGVEWIRVMIDDAMDRRFQKMLEDFQAVSPGHGPGRGYRIQKAKKFTVSMPPAVYEQLKKLARKPETVSSHVCAAVQAYLLARKIEEKK